MSRKEHFAKIEEIGYQDYMAERDFSGDAYEGEELRAYRLGAFLAACEKNKMTDEELEAAEERQCSM